MSQSIGTPRGRDGREPRADTPTNAAARPLAGIRIVDFTWSVAGPTMTRFLAALGAEVIKIEWPRRADPMRNTMFRAEEKTLGIDRGAFFANLNIGKRSLTINMKDPRGHEYVRRLIATSNMIAESYSSGVFASWGFDDARLRELREDIVYVSVSGFGHTGRDAGNDTWGPTAQAFNGLSFMGGLPDTAPSGWGWSFMDTVAGYQATIAALMALHHQREFGVGQYVDLSQVESGLALNGTAVLDAEVNGRDLRVPTFPPGNRTVWPGGDPATAYRGDLAAPYGLYPTTGGGDYDYCAVTVMDDGQWESLKGLLGRPAWADAAPYATVEGRIAGQEDIDAHLREWTSDQEKYGLAALLQDAGVAAGALQSPQDRMDHDPQLAAREVFPIVSHPLIGDFRAESVPFLIDGRRPELAPQWPILGEANRYVMTEIVGLSDEEYESAERDGLFWPADMERDYEFPQQLW